MLQKYSGRIIGPLKSLARRSTFDSAALAAERPRALQGNNRNYQRFVVLSHQRSGSSLVINTLAKHPHVIGFGELFNLGRIAFNWEEFDNNSAKLLAFRNLCPIAFLEGYVFSAYRDDVRAVGFKLFPDQIDNPALRYVWKWLAQNEDVKIIYLTRRNLLATYTSLLVAEKDGKFGIRDTSERTQTTIAIDPEKCLIEFQKRKRYHDTVEKKLQRHEVIQWTYEDLAGAPEEHLQQAQLFLGVDICDLRISSVRQEVRPLSDVIDNYDELREYFTGTEWEYLFEDQPTSLAQEPSVSGNSTSQDVADTIRQRPKKHALPAGGVGGYFKRPAVAGSAIAISLLFVGFFLMQMFASKTAAQDQTMRAIGQIASRIKTYVHEHRELPPALDALQAQDSSITQVTDAWSRPLDYSVVGPDTFVLISYGSDGVPGGSGDGSDIVRTYQVVDNDVRDFQ